MLYFPLVVGGKKIKKVEKGVESARSKLNEKGEAVVRAMQEERLAEQELQAKAAKLQKERAAHAHRGFEAAAEASQGAEG